MGDPMLQPDELSRRLPAWLDRLLYPPDVDEGTPQSSRAGAWSDLVAGVLDSRTDEASQRFDDELAASVANGSVPEQTAQRLRFWQRASVRGVAEHVRTVFPATLRALEVAREEERAYVEEASSDLTAAAAGSDATRTGAGDVRRASAAAGAQPRTLEERRPRLLIADLTDARKGRTE